MRSPWLIVSWLLAVVGLLLGLVTASTGDVFGLLLGGAISAVSGWAVLRIPFMRVTATMEGVTNHGILGKRHAPSSDIDVVALEQTDDRIVGRVFAPVLRLKGGAKTTLTQLSGYSTPERAQLGRVGRQTERLRRLLA